MCNFGRHFIGIERFVPESACGLVNWYFRRIAPLSNGSIFHSKMANETRERKKRKSENADDHQAKRPRDVSLGFQNYAETSSAREAIAGKIERIFVRNFMCHEALEIKLNPNVNFTAERDGSGKSAILTALVVRLGARANITNRGTFIKEFIKRGKNSAMIEVTIINEGPMVYKQTKNLWKSDYCNP